MKFHYSHSWSYYWSSQEITKSRQNGELPKVIKLLESCARIKPPVVILHLQYIYKNFKYKFIRTDFNSEEIQVSKMIWSGEKKKM